MVLGLGVPVRQHYKVAMSAHCRRSVPVLIGPEMLLGYKTPTNSKQDTATIYNEYTFFLHNNPGPSITNCGT